MKDPKSPSEAKGPWELQPRGAFLLSLQYPQRCLTESNFCALGLDSGAHSPVFSMVWLRWGYSSRWHTANIRASPQTLRIGDTVFLSQRVSPSSKRPANPRPSSPATWIGNERRMTQRPPLCSLGHVPCGSSGRATDVPTLVLPTLPVPLGKLCTLSAGGSTGGTRTPFF